MIQISQDTLTRKWGFRIVEGDTANPMEISRQLYEDYSYDSPNTVYTILADIQKALEANRVKNTHDGIIYGYTLWGMGNTIVMSEGGWMSQEDVNNHIASIKSNVGIIRMLMLPKPKVMNLGGGNNNGASAPLVSTYNNPVTGETKIFGNTSQSSQELLNRARQMEQNEGSITKGWE